MILLTAPIAFASDSEAAHRFCMAKMQEGPAIALHERFRPLTGSDEEWDRLVSVVLETWHVACFSLLGVKDKRTENNQMPWVSPVRLSRVSWSADRAVQYPTEKDRYGVE